MLALNKASVVADIGTSGQLWDTPNIELHVYMYVYIYLVQKHQNLKTITL